MRNTLIPGGRAHCAWQEMDDRQLLYTYKATSMEVYVIKLSNKYNSAYQNHAS